MKFSKYHSMLTLTLLASIFPQYFLYFNLIFFSFFFHLYFLSRTPLVHSSKLIGGIHARIKKKKKKKKKKRKENRGTTLEPCAESREQDKSSTRQLIDSIIVSIPESRREQISLALFQQIYTGTADLDKIK